MSKVKRVSSRRWVGSKQAVCVCEKVGVMMMMMMMAAVVVCARVFSLTTANPIRKTEKQTQDPN